MLQLFLSSEIFMRKLLLFTWCGNNGELKKTAKVGPFKKSKDLPMMLEGVINEKRLFLGIVKSKIYCYFMQHSKQVNN